MSKRYDEYAQIAAGGIGGRVEELITPQPVEIEKKDIVLEKADEQYKILQVPGKMSTKEQLQAELQNQLETYKPFLENLAPAMESFRKRMDLEEFSWRMEMEEDLRAFPDTMKGGGEWEKITIPHFGGPLGYAISYYYTETFIEKVQSDQCVYICLKGADYKARVYINGHFAGEHEGFFATFEFDATPYVCEGKNSILIRLENDYILRGGRDEKGRWAQGDKIYAATGLGYDDPEHGWHHCPAGMGIYNDVYIEVRSRLYISDIFVRPLIGEKTAEVWAEVYNTEYDEKDLRLKLSMYGQNFEQTVAENLIYQPSSMRILGLGDSYSEAMAKANGQFNNAIPLFAGKGGNLFKIPIKIEDLRLWQPDKPYLYQIQITLTDAEGKHLDTGKRQFGMRSFEQDNDSFPKGMYSLNGENIRLRGANTMGFEQQCVMKKDFDQLIKDILLAKICNMNFLRLSQRPVQEEVYEYCDKLGLMTQTDLPLFGCMRRTSFNEGIKQAEEMERLIRSHACNISISYINEPFPNAHNKPHRHLERSELEDFFAAADIAVRLNNPDRVIKHVDGDYDPPNKLMPDSHCYPLWYNAHGIDIGKLHKGYWLMVKPDWYYGCGEFGAEGLDCVEVMREYCPKSWLPQSAEEEENWSPSSIIGAQTGNFHYFFFETQKTLEDWVAQSQKHQAFATKMAAEAFRRDHRMISFAVHYFIDAFPTGGMKAIMDCKRNPKAAYFAYKNALAPIMVSLRSDRFKFYEQETVRVEAWVCNDTNEILDETVLMIELYQSNQCIKYGRSSVQCGASDSAYNGHITIDLPEVEQREQFVLKAVLVDKSGAAVTYDEFEFEVFPNIEFQHPAIIIKSFQEFQENAQEILKRVEQGETLIFENLAEGEYGIAGSKINVKNCGMLPLHFAARNLEHKAMEVFREDDFKLWYEKEQDMLAPILYATFTSDDFTAVLTSGNMNKEGEWGKVFAVGEKIYGKGKIIICQLDVTERIEHNPIAKLFLHRLTE